MAEEDLVLEQLVGRERELGRGLCLADSQQLAMGPLGIAFAVRLYQSLGKGVGQVELLDSVSVAILEEFPSLSPLRCFEERTWCQPAIFAGPFACCGGVVAQPLLESQIHVFQTTCPLVKDSAERLESGTEKVGIAQHEDMTSPEEVLGSHWSTIQEIGPLQLQY